jgi:hypothetical protein
MSKTPMAQTIMFETPMTGNLCSKHLCRYVCSSKLCLELACFSDTINLSGDLWFQTLSMYPGADPGFQVGGGGHIWENCAEQREVQKSLGYFVWKITILRPKIIFFPILGGCATPVTYPGSAYKTTTNHETTQTPTGTWTRDLASHRLI